MCVDCTEMYAALGCSLCDSVFISGLAVLFIVLSMNQETQIGQLLQTGIIMHHVL